MTDQWPFTPGDARAIRAVLADQDSVQFSGWHNPWIGQADGAAMLVKALEASGLVVGVEALAAREQGAAPGAAS